MKLTESDFKLLSYLYHHNREPLSKVAKACKLSREQVAYKLAKYQREGLIKGFFTFFDWSKFGYANVVGLLLKFEKPSFAKKFAAKIIYQKNCMSHGKIHGKYDAYVNCIFQDEKELADFITGLMDESETPISDYPIIKPYFFELYPVKFFKHKDRMTFTYSQTQSIKRKFDAKELEILKILAKDARARVIDIASETKISAELVVYKIRKLQEDGVIKGTRIQFDMSKLGYYFSILMLTVKDFSKSKQEKIINYARNSPRTNSLQLLLGKPNCAIQIFHKEEKELRETIEEINELFKDDSIDIDILLVGEDEGPIRTLPFLK